MSPSAMVSSLEIEYIIHYIYNMLYLMQEGTSQGLDESQCISVKCQWCKYYYSLREINKHMLQCVEAQKKEDRKSNVSTNVR